MAFVNVDDPYKLSVMNFSNFIPTPTEPNRFIAYVRYTLNAAKRHAISRNRLYGIDITGSGSYFIKVAFGAHDDSVKDSQRILEVPLQIVGAESREYITCGYNSPDPKEHVKRLTALDIVGAWFRKIIGEKSSYGIHKNLDHFLKIQISLDVKRLGLKGIHLAAGGESLLAHRSMFCLVPDNAECLPSALPKAAYPNKKDLQWSESGEPKFKISEEYMFIDEEFSEEQKDRMGMKAERILGVRLSRSPGIFTCMPFDHQLIEYYEERNQKYCSMAIMILRECAENARYLREQRQEKQNALECLFELATESNMTLEKLYEAATSKRREWTNESIITGNLAISNGNGNQC
ncbi:hypothetical protein EYC80_001507 [Monilinia laxa]|uniref:Uncharacterized protein n=1 Tax=Monilinia laxa TaxID=61186 RepID=A0A5N6K5A2_MONLA|nr:hypothetical protein EYC80_001507 [Monilinia laxa]